MWYFFVYNNFVYQSFSIYLILDLAKYVFFFTVVRYISLNIADASTADY